MRLSIAALAFLFINTASAPQDSQTVSVPKFNLHLENGQMAGFFGAAPFSRQPPTFLLTPKSEGARKGRLWVRNAEEGLLIVGEVDGPPPDWATDRATLLARDHIEVWIAGAPDPDLPRIGWAIELKSAQDCETFADGMRSSTANAMALAQALKAAETCRNWYAQQLKYRPLLHRLFARQFVFTYRETVEEFATPAYMELVSKFLPEYVPHLLEPKHTAEATLAPSVGPNFALMMDPNKTGYNFQIYIPYSAFPPLRQLAVQDLWLMVNVFSPAHAGQKEGPYATSTQQGEWGKPATFNHIRLDPPQQFVLSPCHAPLHEKDMYGQYYPAWFFPPAHRQIVGGVVPSQAVEPWVTSDFIIGNFAADDEDVPTEPSPNIWEYRHFWKQLTDGAYVCGPDLAYRKGPVSVATDEEVSTTGFDGKILPDGWTLVKSGPEAANRNLGRGECGTCPIARLKIWAISPQGDAQEALNIDQLLDVPLAGADLDISRDWTRATLFEAYGNYPGSYSWTSTSYCLDGHIYEKCGEAKNVNPPNPPKLPALRPQ